MTKIKLMGVREEDEHYIEMWSQQHEVEVDMSKEQLTEDTSNLLKDLMDYHCLKHYHYQKQFIIN